MVDNAREMCRLGERTQRLSGGEISLTAVEAEKATWRGMFGAWEGSVREYV